MAQVGRSSAAPRPLAAWNDTAVSALDQVRTKAQSAGFEEAICSNCGRFDDGDGTMGRCRARGGEVQLRYGICLQWSTSSIVPMRRATVVAEDGSKRLFGAEPPLHDEGYAGPPGKVDGLECAELGCGGKLELRHSGRLGRWFYGCSRYPSCSGILPANDDGSPHGDPRTRELQGWRRKAHDTFDVLWKNKHCSRPEAYSWLRHATGLSHEQAHMFQMTAEQCQDVIRFVTEKGPGTEFWEQWRAYRAEKKRVKKRRAKR